MRILNNVTIFCASLPEAFASVAMRFPDQNMEPGKLSRFSTNDKPADTAGWCKLFADGSGAVFGCNRAAASFGWQFRDAKALLRIA